MKLKILGAVTVAFRRQFAKSITFIKRIGKALANPYKAINKFIKDTVNLLTMPPSKREDYLQIGRTLLSKRFIIFALFGIVTTGTLIYTVIFPFLEGRLWVPKIKINSDRFFSYA